MPLYLQYLYKEEQINDMHDDLLRCLINVEEDDEEGPLLAEPTRKARKKRSCKTSSSMKPYYFNKGGQVFLSPQKTIWYFMYVTNPMSECPRWNKNSGGGSV